MLTFIFILFFKKKSLLVSFFLLVVLASSTCRLHKEERDAKEFWANDTSFLDRLVDKDEICSEHLPNNFKRVELQLLKFL